MNYSPVRISNILQCSIPCFTSSNHQHSLYKKCYFSFFILFHISFILFSFFLSISRNIKKSIHLYCFLLNYSILQPISAPQNVNTHYKKVLFIIFIHFFYIWFILSPLSSLQSEQIVILFTSAHLSWITAFYRVQIINTDHQMECISHWIKFSPIIFLFLCKVHCTKGKHIHPFPFFPGLPEIHVMYL